MPAANPIYIDRLSLWVIVRVLLPWIIRRLLTRRGDLNIHYFVSSAWARRLVTALENALPFQCRELDYSIAEVRDTNGAVAYENVMTADALEIVTKCLERELQSHPLVCRTGRRFSNGRLVAYLKRRLDTEISPSLLKVAVAAWHHRTFLAQYSGQATLYTTRVWWSHFLEEYARAQGIRLRPYRTFPHLRSPLRRRYMARAVRLSKAVLTRLARFMWRPPPGERRVEAGQPPFPVIAAPFDGDGISLGNGYNSDFFWYPASAPAPGQVLLYCWSGIDPLDQNKADLLDQAGIRYVAIHPSAAACPQVTVWTPSLVFIRKFCNLNLWLLGQTLLSLRHSPRRLTWLAPKIVSFLFDYSYWEDFFRTHQVKVHLSRPGRRIAAEQALADLGGISVTYQRSHTCFPSSILTYTADVHFAFSPDVANMLRRCGACVGQLVATGYVHDYGFTRAAARSAQLRRRLQEHGARFIVSFLDQGTGYDKKTNRVSDEQLAEDYLYLLTRLHEDPGLGIIFKPKRPTSLHRVLGDVSGLLDTALAEGRCYVFEQGGVYSNTLPCEASLAADVAIGLLIGEGTASLESRLAGTPAILLDRDRVSYHPLYGLGQNSVIFQGWDVLWQTLLAYRENPASVPGFGDWSSWLHRADPFQDGRAGERIGSYLGWLAAGLQADLTKAEVLEQTRQRYSEIWGEDKVVQWDCEEPSLLSFRTQRSPSAALRINSVRNLKPMSASTGSVAGSTRRLWPNALDSSLRSE